MPSPQPWWHRGSRRGTVVALLLPNCPQFVIGQLGAWKAGAIVVPLNPLYTEHELPHMLTDCGAETALVLTPFYEKVKAAQPHTTLRRVIATNIKEYLPAHLRLLFSALKEKKEGHRIALQDGDLWLGDLLRKYAKAPRPEVVGQSAGPGPVPVHGRHDRHAESRRGHPSRAADHRDATEGLVWRSDRGLGGRGHGPHAPVPLLRQRRHPGYCSARPLPPGAGSEPARSGRPAGHDPEGAPGPAARRADVAHRHAQPSPGPERKGGPPLDQALLLFGVRAAGRDQEPL